eukprot:Pgem_evm1s9398
MPHIISEGQTCEVAGRNINETISFIETQLFYEEINNLKIILVNTAKEKAFDRAR